MNVEKRELSDGEAIYRCTTCNTDKYTRESAEKCCATPVAKVDTYHVPADLQEMDVWSIWDCRDKTPRAPWRTGNMYPCKWGHDLDEAERPETSYEKARMTADMGVRKLNQVYGFPDDSDLPTNVEPGVILPHEPATPPLMFVDFDDVRNPETGEITEEVQDLLNRLDAYTEVSSSGTGLHCYVRAALPGTLGKFLGDLHEEGHIELYDHGRFTGGTWRHVEGTPLDTVPERQGVIDAIVDEYESEEERAHRENAAREEVEKAWSNIGNKPSQRTQNAYYHIPMTQVLSLGNNSHLQRRGGQLQGAHPAHGGTSSADSESMNFTCDGDTWFCFAHHERKRGGGGPLQLLAVIEGVVNCEFFKYRSLTGEPKKLAKTCLIARENGFISKDEDPPYKALVGIAHQHDLVFSDEDKGILGEDTWKIARIIYDESEPGEIDC